ncbi:MAG TPA: permease, partial [Geobacteraceae bacterium]
VYGPSGRSLQGAVAGSPFPLVFAHELWDLLANPHGILAELRDVFPYFAVGIFLAGYLRTYKVAVKLHASLRRHGIKSVFLASFIGIITPLCACGTVTTAISLLFAGMPLAPVMALMVTSPLMSPTTYLLTLNDLGPEWTVIRTVSAYAMGIFAGTVTHILARRGFIGNDIFIEGAIVRGDFHDEDYPDERLRCNCRERFGNRVAARTGNKFLVFLAKSVEMVWPVGKYVLVGVAMGAVVERYLPSTWLYNLFGRKDPLAIVWVTLASVPVFLHQISASSVLCHVKSSLDGTLDGGAALAFMIGGPVTAIPTMVMFWTIFKKRVFWLYMGVCIVGTILIASAFQAFLFVPGADTGNPLLRGVKTVSGGSSCAIKKLDPNVAIVMDPGGRNIIATYSNPLESRGGVVFDADARRFLDAADASAGNGRYVTNVARWLDDGAGSRAKGTILVCDLSGGGGAHGWGGLEREGFAVRAMDRAKTPLTEALLAQYGQVWLLFDARGEGLSAAELGAVSRFVDGGGSMLVAVRGGGDAPERAAAANRLSSRYGVLFTGSADNKAEIPATVASGLFAAASDMLGKVLKYVHKA